MRHLIRCMAHTCNELWHQDINANHVFDVSCLCLDIRTQHNLLYIRNLSVTIAEDLIQIPLCLYFYNMFTYVFILTHIPARHMCTIARTQICWLQGPARWRGKYYQYRITVFCPDTQQVETLTTTDPYSLCLAADGTHTQVSPTPVM